MSLGPPEAVGSPGATSRSRQPWGACRNKRWPCLAAKAVHSQSVTSPDVNPVVSGFFCPLILEEPEALRSESCGCSGSQVDGHSYCRRWPEGRLARQGGLENGEADPPVAGRLGDSCPTGGCRLRCVPRVTRQPRSSRWAWKMLAQSGRPEPGLEP